MVDIRFSVGNCDACRTRYDANGNRIYCDASDCVYTGSPSYNAGGLMVDPSVSTVEGCRVACQQYGSCSFFSWELEARARALEPPE
jgi:hypothetical protein